MGLCLYPGPKSLSGWAQHFDLFYLMSYDDEIWYVGTTLSNLDYD